MVCVCAERSQHSRPEAARLRRTCLQDWPLDGVRELVWGKFSSFSDKNDSLWLNCADNVACAEHTLSFGESGRVVHARQGVPT